MDCPLFWEAVKNQSHPRHKLAPAAVQDTRNRQAENDLQTKEPTSGEIMAKTVKAKTEVKDAGGGRRYKEFTRDKLRESSCRGHQ